MSSINPGGPITGGGGIIDTGGGEGGFVPPPPTDLTIVTASPLPFATNGMAYITQVQAINNVGSITWTIAAGSLPVGLTLNPITGIISGTPTTITLSTFTVQAVDSTQALTTKLFLLQVREAAEDPLPRYNQNSLAGLAQQLAISLRDPNHA